MSRQPLHIAPICSGAVAPVASININQWHHRYLVASVVSNTATERTPLHQMQAVCHNNNIDYYGYIQVSHQPLLHCTDLCRRCCTSIAINITNGITGTWSPAVVSNTASGTYTFTPTAGQCATPTTMMLRLIPIVTPTFNPFGSLCLNSVAPALPLTSINGITGTWSPAAINTSVVGTTTYTFTPAVGQCATTATLDITIDAQITPVFTAIGPLCVNAAAPVLPPISNNGITGTWSPATISTSATGTTTYTFTPAVVSVPLQQRLWILRLRQLSPQPLPDCCNL